MPYPVKVWLASLAGSTIIIAAALLLSSCSGLCGYHGSGCSDSSLDGATVVLRELNR